MAADSWTGNRNVSVCSPHCNGGVQEERDMVFCFGQKKKNEVGSLMSYTVKPYLKRSLLFSRQFCLPREVYFYRYPNVFYFNTKCMGHQIRIN